MLLGGNVNGRTVMELYGSDTSCKVTWDDTQGGEHVVIDDSAGDNADCAASLVAAWNAIPGQTAPCP